MRQASDPLPIEPVLPALRDALREVGAAVLQAPRAPARPPAFRSPCLRNGDLGAALLDLLPRERRVLAVKLHEMFGQTETPLVARGRVPLTLHLLSPAGRPVQVTRDLAGFWRTTYFEVRKDLKGRYPKHPWPDDPLEARPTRHAKLRVP